MKTPPHLLPKERPLPIPFCPSLLEHHPIVLRQLYPFGPKPPGTGEPGVGGDGDAREETPGDEDDYGEEDGADEEPGGEVGAVEAEGEEGDDEEEHSMRLR